VTPSALDYGSVNIGTKTQAKTVVINNTGGAPLVITAVNTSRNEYALATGTNACTTTTNATVAVTVPVGGTCNLYVTLTAAGAGSRAGTLSIVSNSGTNTVSLSGTGAQVPVASPSLASLDFGINKLNMNPASQTVTITNSGAANSTLTLGATSIINSSASPSPFTVSNNTCTGTLSQGASCSITVAFASTALGSYSADLQLLSDTGGTTGTPLVIPLVSTVATPVASLTSLVTSFGPAAIGSSSSTAATLTNDGAVALTISNVAFTAVSGDSTAFSQTNNCGASLLPAASCTITVSYKPTAYLAASDVVNLVVTDDDGGVTTTQSIRFTGATIAPSPLASLTGALAFGNTVTVGSSALKVATLTNSGTAPLAISAIGVTNTLGTNYSVNSNTCLVAPATSGTLAAGASCTITVKFAPTKTKTVSAGTLTVTDNTGNVVGSKQTLAITGTSK